MTRFEVAEAIVIACYEDLKRLPGFVEDVPRDALKNVSKLAPYIMTDEIRCGIKDCHQPHNEGCAIRATNDSITITTNIGHCCAARILGVDWVQAKREYNERASFDDKKRLINAFLDDPRAIISDVFKVWYDGDVRWLDEARTDFLEGAPQRLRDVLEKRAKSGTTQVVQAREREEDDLTAHLGFSSRGADNNNIVTIPVGNLVGLNCIKLCAWDLVCRQVYKMAQQLAGQNPATMSARDIGDCARQLRSFRRKLQRAKELVAEGRAFFTRENFALFGPLLEQDCRAGASDVMRVYQWDFDRCRWSVSPKLGRRSGPRAA